VRHHVTFDTGALIALEKGDARMLALLRRFRDPSWIISVPAGVVAQAVRTRRQDRLAPINRLLKTPNVDVVFLDRQVAYAIGMLLAGHGGRDVIDGSVVECALRRGGPIVTSDPNDLIRILPGVHARLHVV
jgi:predicted nucleic acid-binding protein